MSRFARKVETTSQPTKSIRPSRFKKVIEKEFEPSIPNGSPRMPSIEACGHKPYGLFVCGLPKGHNGPCNKVDPPEIDAKIIRRMQTSCPITLTFDNETIPEELTDILYAWKKTGNNWGSGLETELLVFSKGLKFEHGAGNPYAIGCLMFLGYMEALPPNPHDSLSVRKYRLSKKGLEATDEIARRIGDVQTNLTTSAVVEMDEETKVDCVFCEGTGVHSNGELCSNCEGTGVYTETSSYKTTKIEENTKFTTQPQKRSNKLQKSLVGVEPDNSYLNFASYIVEGKDKDKKKTVEVYCVTCNGTGVNSRSRLCIKCKGTGTE